MRKLLLRWESPRPGEAMAMNREDPSVVYDVIEVPVPRRGSEWMVWVGTEVGKYRLDPPPQRNRQADGFRDMRAAQQACQKHFEGWRREIAESRDVQAKLPLTLGV
jgi:hypothetical protein